MESWFSPQAVQQVGIPFAILVAIGVAVWRVWPWVSGNIDKLVDAHAGFIGKLDGILDNQTALLDKISDKQEEHDKHLRAIRRQLRESDPTHEQRRPPAA